MFITNVFEVLITFSTDKYASKSSFQACALMVKATILILKKNLRCYTINVEGLSE